MRTFYGIAAGLLTVALVGCQTGTSTAPGTNPQKPDQVRELTVKVPAGEQNVTQDATNDVNVSIDRKNFDGAVAIELRDLPPGVEVTTKDMTIPAGQDSVKVTLKAAPDAAPKDDHAVTVVAKPKDQADMKEATVTFKLDVKAKGK